MMQNILFTESPIDYFRKASQILLNRESSFEELSRATKALHTVLGRITGIEGAITDPKEKYETNLPSGFALSPGYAADCTLDTIRIRNNMIKERESGITFPHFALDLSKFGPGDILKFSFRITDNPGIHYKLYSELRL